MEAVGAAANVVIIIVLTEKVLTHAKLIKGAPQEYGRFIQEGASLLGLLIKLDDHLSGVEESDPWAQSLIKTMSPGGAVDQYRLAVERLTAKLGQESGRL